MEGAEYPWKMGDEPPIESSLPLSAVGDSPASKPGSDEEEVAELFNALRDPLLRYLFTIGLPFQDGEEVIQEVFLALFLHLRRGKSRRHLRGWLFRVAHNLALKRRGPARCQDWATQFRPADDLAIDSTPNAEDQFAIEERQRRLLGVWRALPEVDRRCLALRAEGLSYREITEVLGISLGTVSTLLSRCLARFTRATER
jgi:RNA polymerase sigma-70 factor (ECF subfamily)